MHLTLDRNLPAGKFYSLMRILIVHTSRTARLGGGQTFSINLLNALRWSNVDCELFWIGEAPWGYSHENTSSGTLAELVNTVLRRKVDVVHAAVSDWDSGVALVRRLSRHAALVVTNHGEVYPGWNSRNCDGIVGCSAWTAAAQQAATDLPVQVVYNGIDTDRFVPAPRIANGAPIVAWVGRGADWVKGLDQFAPIAPLLKNAGFRVWLADPDGPGKVMPEVARLLGPAADRWEAIAQESMPAFYQEIAASGGCVMLTSRSEGLGLGLIEAQACGCPVISVDIRGPNECVDPKRGGILYRPDLDPPALATLVRESLADVDAMKARRQACAEHARDRFSLDKMGAEYSKVYAEASVRRRRPTGCGRRQAVRLSLRERRRLNWSAAHSQYGATIDFYRSGQCRLARTAAWESFRTLPTIYIRLSRLTQLFRAAFPAMWRGRVAGT